MSQHPTLWLLACTCAMAAAQAHAQSTPAAYLQLFDHDGDGRVSEQEYVDRLSAGFLAMDSNHDGTLEPSELPGHRGRAVTLVQHQANLRRQFRKLDRNHDGVLDARELAQPPQ
ncbi:EF-hand domain-containing protein [Dyella sp.]|uniref:EF-hand domain-containing protein n=1 Tax=Dyella sp. TaxID=1869338 RepID=UPI003F8137CC